MNPTAAPTSIMPSMPMLRIPLRSISSSPIEARTRGAAYTSVCCHSRGSTITPTLGDVDLGVVAAGEQAIAGAAVEERTRRTRGPQPRALRVGRRHVDLEAGVVDHADHDPVDVERGLRSHLAL